jgi:hypothetical protein
MRKIVGEGPDSLSGRRRLARWSSFQSRFPVSDMTVLDLGGTAESWATAGLRPARLVLLNAAHVDHLEGVDQIVGDACDPPAELLDQHFDLVFSNSVIEHVGGHARRQQFAAVADRLGSALWIQTPYRYFPLEPHFVFPGLQFLPLAARARVIEHWPLVTVADHQDAVVRLQNVELLSRTELGGYFPGCELVEERVGGLVKSLIAVRDSSG